MYLAMTLREDIKQWYSWTVCPLLTGASLSQKLGCAPMLGSPPENISHPVLGREGGISFIAIFGFS